MSHTLCVSMGKYTEFINNLIHYIVQLQFTGNCLCMPKDELANIYLIYPSIRARSGGPTAVEIQAAQVS